MIKDCGCPLLPWGLALSREDYCDKHLIKLKEDLKEINRAIPIEVVQNILNKEVKMKFDPTKPCQTKSGSKVRIICIDGKADSKLNSPIIGLIELQDGNELLRSWSLNGCYLTSGFESSSDLINIPENPKKIEKTLEKSLYCDDSMLDKPASNREVKYFINSLSNKINEIVERLNEL